MEKDIHKEDEIPGLGKDMPFSVPDGYFEELPNRIMAQLPESPVRRVAWWAHAQFWRIAAPALLLVLIAIGYQTLGPSMEVSTDSLMAEVSDDELVAFLEQELDATDVLHYDLAYLEESEDELEGSLWEGSIEDQAVEEYLDDISLDDLEEYGLDEIDL